MLNQNFVLVGVLISVIGEASYFVDTIKGKIQPNRVSFTLWSIAPFIAFFAEINQRIGIQSLLPLSVGLIPIIILVGTFVNKKSYWKISKFDLICGCFSIFGLLLWYITKVGNWAIFFSILADGLAYIPTITKAYKFPETESAWPWLATSCSGLFTLLTIKNFDFAYVGFPAYYFIINVIVFVIVHFKLGKHK